jgi:hypothetical protein
VNHSVTIGPFHGSIGKTKRPGGRQCPRACFVPQVVACWRPGVKPGPW